MARIWIRAHGGNFKAWTGEIVRILPDPEPQQWLFVIGFVVREQNRVEYHVSIRGCNTFEIQAS
jgi:hypothetical protein